jgi:hypothetical protein
LVRASNGRGVESGLNSTRVYTVPYEPEYSTNPNRYTVLQRLANEVGKVKFDSVHYSLTLTKVQNRAMEILLNGSPAEVIYTSPLEEFYSVPENVLPFTVLSQSIFYDRNIWKLVRDYAGESKCLALELIASKLEAGQMRTWVEAGCPAQ